MMLFLCLTLLYFVRAQTGTPLGVNADDLLLSINRERQTWHIPILDWDDDLAKVATERCKTCDVLAPTGTNDNRGPILADLKGFTWVPGTRYQSTGETRAAAAGAGANPTAKLWIQQRSEWTCATDTCQNGGTTCNPYKQVVWLNTRYVGCNKCQCEQGNPFPQDGNQWEYLVCVWNEAGNFPEHPFGTDSAAVCSGNWNAPPPPQPKPCGFGCSDLANCPSPASTATCGSDGVWKIEGNAAISDIKNVSCPTTITGSLSGGEEDILELSRCGTITASSLSFTGSPKVEIDFQGIDGLAPRQFHRFLNVGGAGPGGATFGVPILKNVWTPTVDLCAKTVIGTSGAYVFFFDCGIANPSIASPLPDGSLVLSTGPSFETFNPPVSGGDINDPELTGRPRPNGPSPSSGSPNGGSPSDGGGGLPGWAIFLIVLVVILIIIVILVILFLRMRRRANAETV